MKRRVATADLSDISTWTRQTFEEGANNALASATPDRFGSSQSCPFLVLRPPPVITNVPPFRCEDSKPQTLTITGTDFPDTPVLTVTNPKGVVTTPTILASSSTSITFTSVFLVCGTWTFQVQGSNVFSIHVCKPGIAPMSCWGPFDPNANRIGLIRKDVQP